MDDQVPPVMLWVAGDRWRDLTDELRTGPSTVVTWNGTSRLLDPGDRWQLRVPLIGGHAMGLDGLRQRLTDVAFASPCGVVTLDRERWHATSRVVAVLAGLHPAWAAGSDGREILDEHAADPRAPDHPNWPCPTHLCVLRG